MPTWWPPRRDDDAVPGGWSLPVAGLNQPAAATIGTGLLHIAIFLAKMCFLIFMVIWVRWMWPRFRYDQLMDTGWRGLFRWRWPTSW